MTRCSPRGRVFYVHGLATDEPIAIVRYNYVDFFNTATNHIAFPPTSLSLFWNALGKLGPVVCGDGKQECTATSGGRTAVMGMDVPSNFFVLDRPQFLPARRYFQGTLTADKQDANGTLFRRTRYYDPSTGRFTQEDPIGLAGGLNLYSFASGDAVNFSDPFGLCGKKESQEPCPKGHVVTISAGVAGAYLLGGNGNIGVAFSGEGMRVFANSGGSFGMGGKRKRVFRFRRARLTRKLWVRECWARRPF
jgi:RHS repeat-associated protein